MIFAVFDVLAVNMCINYSFFTFMLTNVNSSLSNGIRKLLQAAERDQDMEKELSTDLLRHVGLT